MNRAGQPFRRPSSAHLLGQDSKSSSRTDPVVSCFITRTFQIVALLCLTCLQAGAKPEIVSARDWGSSPLEMPLGMRQTPQRLVLHHSGMPWVTGSDPKEKIRALQRWGQREKGWPDVPYHFLITPDGQIFEGRDWHYQPDSNTSYSLNGVLNVELFGNFEKDAVSRQQLESLLTLLSFLCEEFEISPSDISSHRQNAPGQTVCPGRDLQRYLDGPLRAWVRDRESKPFFWFMTLPEGRL